VLSDVAHEKINWINWRGISSKRWTTKTISFYILWFQ